MPIQGCKFRAFLTLVLVCTCTGLLYASTTVQDDKERQIRAAFLLNFMKFTTWPDAAFSSKNSEIVLAIVGSDPFGRILEQTFAREQVRGRKVKLLRLPVPNRDDYGETSKYDEAVAELRGKVEKSHMAYFSDCDRAALDLVLVGIDKSRVLTVGDQRECAEYRTALALEREGDRVIFHANVKEIESLDLQVSSRLLALAKIIKE